MLPSPDPDSIQSEAELDGIYRQPAEHVKNSTLDFLHDFHLAYLKVAPIVCIGSGAAEGYDVSPRGGPPGFVHVLDRKTLAIPDFPGNNKIETLRNIVRSSRVALLFLFPGLDIFMRISGRGSVTRNSELRQRLVCSGKQPITVIVITVETVYFHCGRAISRSRIWDPATHISRESVPSPGEMMKVLARIGEQSAAELDEFYRRGMTEELY
jgi:PPOX class probable FMN-dependent enzyme